MAALRLSSHSQFFTAVAVVSTFEPQLFSLSTSSQLSPIEENFGISRTSTETPTPHTEDLQTLLNIVQRLINEIAAARSETEQLRATTAQLQNQSSKNHVSSSQPEPLLATASQSSLDFPGHNAVSTPCRNPE